MNKFVLLLCPLAGSSLKISFNHKTKWPGKSLREEYGSLVDLEKLLINYTSASFYCRKVEKVIN